MRTFLLTLFLSLARLAFCQDNTGISEITGIMKKQELAWNKADIEGFMQYYWKSDSLKFIGSKGITYGWQKTLDNYKKNYPNQDAMGILTFENSTMEQLSPERVFVIGKWHLKKKDSEVGGYYTLLWKKLKGKWVIVIDHTS